MAKPPGPKTILIRDAIKAHPDLGNTEIAALISGSPAREQDGIKVTAADIAQQKQRMKRGRQAGAGEGAAPKKAARNGRRKTQSGPAAEQPREAAEQPATATATGPASRTAAARASTQNSPVDVMDRLFDLARQCGGFGALKRLVDRMAQMERD